MLCPPVPADGVVPFPRYQVLARKERVMPRIAEQALPVTGGVETHADVHVARRWTRWAGCWAPGRSRLMRLATPPRWRGCAPTASGQ